MYEKKRDFLKDFFYKMSGWAEANYKKWGELRKMILAPKFLLKKYPKKWMRVGGPAWVPDPGPFSSIPLFDVQRRM